MPAQAIAVSSLLEERLKGRRAALGALRNLPGGYQLFYSPSMRSNKPDEAADPVVDYILAHPQKGLLGVVVKSGEIVEEPGGFISQFQPVRGVYKLLDPVKPADMALRALLMGFDVQSNRVFPCGVAVLFPEAQRLEFSQPQSCYLFAEDIASISFVQKLDELFLEPVDKSDQEKFTESFDKLCEFLSRHSDNAAVFEDRRETMKEAAEPKRATPPVSYGNLRMKVAAAQSPEARPATVQKEQTGPTVARASSPPPLQEQPPPAPLQEQKPLAIAKAEKSQVSVALSLASPPRKRRKAVAKTAAPVKEEQQDFFTWMQDVQQKGEGDAALSAGQWVMVIGISVAVICIAYFLSMDLAAALG